MKLICPIHLIVFLAVVTSLGGCGKRHRFVSQLMRPQGILSVVVRSDIRGGISLRFGTPTTPRVTISLREKDGIVVEQQGKETLLYVGKELWYRIPDKTQRLEIRVTNRKIAAKADGVLLVKITDTEHEDANRPR